MSEEKKDTCFRGLLRGLTDPNKDKSKIVSHIETLSFNSPDFSLKNEETKAFANRLESRLTEFKNQLLNELNNI